MNTTIWLQPPAPGSAPIEVEYTHDKIVPLMAHGHRQISADEAAERLKAHPAPTPAPAKIWLKPPDGSTPIEVEAVPDILTPYMQKGYVECPAPVA